MVKLGILLFSLLLCQSALALPEDKEKLMILTADEVDLNQQSHRGTYNGKVRIDQGSTHLRAAHAITEGDKNNKLILAIAQGNTEKPAHCWTQPASDKPILHAYANTIRYYPERHIIELIGNALVKQGNNSFAAAKITYDTLKQHVLSQNAGVQRAKIIIHPEKQTGKTL